MVTTVATSPAGTVTVDIRLDALSSSPRLVNIVSDMVILSFAVFPTISFTVAIPAGEVATVVTKIDGHEIVSTQQSLLQTAFKFNDGKTGGQEKGGFVADPLAKAINWLIIAENAPIAVSKTDVVRVFDPMTNQRANAWDMDYRKYHDIWIPKSKEKSIFVNTVV